MIKYCRLTHELIFLEPSFVHHFVNKSPNYNYDHLASCLTIDLT